MLLGLCYYNGFGVKKDYIQAVNWYLQSANQGNAYSQNGLAMCYEYGRGVSKSLTKAIEWYQKAASGGNDHAKQALERLQNHQSPLLQYY